MNIEQPVSRFVHFCTDDSKELPDHGDLLVELDRLLVSTDIGEFEYDDTDYPDAPALDHAEIRDKICRQFPGLGLYCTSDGEPENMDNSKILVGDAIDDLVGIIADLMDVLWCMENTSVNDAAWHFQFTFRTHWGLHARELQLHLHKYWW